MKRKKSKAVKVTLRFRLLASEMPIKSHPYRKIIHCP
jgi:hypothetical protein